MSPQSLRSSERPCCSGRLPRALASETNTPAVRPRALVPLAAAPPDSPLKQCNSSGAASEGTPG